MLCYSYLVGMLIMISKRYQRNYILKARNKIIARKKRMDYFSIKLFGNNLKSQELTLAPGIKNLFHWPICWIISCWGARILTYQHLEGQNYGTDTFGLNTIVHKHARSEKNNTLRMTQIHCHHCFNINWLH